MPAHPIAAVVIIHGSGPDGRADYRAQAEMFSKMGIAALSYDKRGWDCTGGDWRQRSVDLLASDAVAGADYLRRTIRQPVGYWGISQGGWVLAKVAASDPQAAFLIGVAATGITPIQQELWHKKEMAAAAGYPAWARQTANRYWSGALDLMIQLARHPNFFPNVLVSERASSSFGLAYDPGPDWRTSRAPLLLLYGTNDQLEPWFDSRLRIPSMRSPEAKTQVRTFAMASHAITTRTTGLAFDWGASFHPEYAQTMQSFVVSALNGKSSSPRTPRNPGPWPAPPAYASLVALGGLVGLPILLGCGAILGRSRLIRWHAVTAAVAWLALIALLILVIHPQGSFYDPGARFPTWGGIVLALNVAAIASGVGLIVQALRRRVTILSGLVGALSIAFFAYWL